MNNTEANKQGQFDEGFDLVEAHNAIRTSVAAGGAVTLKSLIGALIGLGFTDEGPLIDEVGKIAGSQHDFNVGEILAQHADGRGEDLWRRLPSGHLYLHINR